MKNKSIITLILTAALICGLMAVCWFGLGRNRVLSIHHIQQGLDLKGGVSITYEAGKENPTEAEMASVTAMIQQRLDQKGYSEAECARQGSDRIRVDIPGVDDAETAISQIGQTAMIQFTDEEGNVLLDGTYVKNAYKSVQPSAMQGRADDIVVVLELDDEGRVLFEQATENNIGRVIYILMDDEVVSQPVVREKISGGSAVITGSGSAAEAEYLAAVIRAGALPFDLNIIDLNSVGARLGADALSAGVLAGALGFGLVMVFMILIYRVSGLAASMALIIYLCLELILLSLLRVTLTLPGIAGIVLSIGMAVDANIIIFERIKEELRAGKSIRAALHGGFARAFSAILDGNITTLIAAAVLFWLGTGPIKGFAQTLSIGILISMFTALVVTRYIIHALVNAGIKNPKHLGVN